MIEDHLEKLKCFHVTAEEGSLVKASLRLGLSQPAITKSIRVLEDLLGTPLFLRHRRGVELTKAGVHLQGFSQHLYIKIRDTEKRIQSSNAIAGVIRVGTYETLGEHFWPKALKQINAQYPDLIVELSTQNSSAIWPKLESGHIDLIVDAEPKINENLFSKVLYTDHFGVFCKKSSQFLEKSQNIPFSYVSRAFDRNGVTIEHHLRNLKMPFQFLYDVESFTMARSLILEDVCVGVLPLSLAKKYVDKGTIQYFGSSKKSTFGEHRICVTSLEQFRRDSKIEIFTKILQSVVVN